MSANGKQDRGDATVVVFCSLIFQQRNQGWGMYSGHQMPQTPDVYVVVVGERGWGGCAQIFLFNYMQKFHFFMSIKWEFSLLYFTFFKGRQHIFPDLYRHIRCLI